VEAADFLTQLTQALGIVVACNVADSSGEAAGCEGQRQGGRALRRVGIDDNLDRSFLDLRRNDVEQGSLGRHNRCVPMIADVLVDLAEQRVERAAAIGIYLDPHGGRSQLPRDPVGCLFHRHLRADPQPGRRNGRLGSRHRRLSRRGEEDRRSVKSGFGGGIGQVRVHAGYPQRKSETEHAPDNAHCG